MDIQIRHLENTDSQDLFDIYRHTSVTQNTSQLPYMSRDKVDGLFLGDDSNYTLVAEADAKVIGHVTLFLSHKIRDRHCAGIAIGVHPDFHGKGVGRLLMNSAIDQADNWLNLIRLELEVLTNNVAAVHLYQSVGFEIEGTKRKSTFFDGQLSDLHLMARVR
ncbi:GNAT family N-acetyltransferase [Vibrio sp. SCSIO 43136]|uniref:GNAT family N-acetyltransferase n=1 Tax=Vibrio sp. SCSIO 43136 TaxID=2819101 RepID=UPI0020751203|nr:GNAT family N-acetyltransferase [Vibrio sp. SCSIO 43136]USD67810.1 GNAT family N-acetyltransferase [Vibrio sp. SCSIO 43136]